MKFRLIESIEDISKEEYGTTTNWRETGWLFKDGTQLDLSGKNMGSRGGTRTIDHREILDDSTDMVKFMRDGNIRISPEIPGINLQVEPTEAQYRKLKSFIENVGYRDGYFAIDFDNEYGYNVSSREYETINVNRIIKDIEDYFKNGKLSYRSELQQFRESFDDMSNEHDNEGNQLTKAQVEFFKDSKVRDEQGRLLVCYHGSNKEFNTFDKNKIRTGTFGNGFYFTSQKYSGDSYGKYNKKYYLNIKKYLTIPVEYEDITEFVADKYFDDRNNERTISNQVATDIVKEKGFDGISTPMYNNWGNFEYYVAFEPNQIKSITNKNPSSSDNINENLLSEAKADTEKFKQWLNNSVDEFNLLKDSKLDHTELFNWFEQNRKNLKSPQNDYYYWIKKPSVQGIEELTEIASQIKDKQDYKRKEQEGADLIYQDNDWFVYYIKNYEASCKYGSNTKWCITGTKRWSNGDGRGQWDKYEKENIKMYFFIDRVNNKKYALALYPNKQFEIFNEEDLELSFIPNAPKIDSIGVNYWDRDDGKLLQYLFIENKLPKELTFSVLSDILVDCIGKGIDFVEVDITDDKEIVFEWINNAIPDMYIEHQAVENGDMSVDEYESITGEPYEDFWGGDIPTMDWDVYDKIVSNYKTKNDVCSDNNPFIKDNKYWKFIYSAIQSIEGYDSFEKLIRDGVYTEYEDYYERDFKDFLDYCKETILQLVAYNFNYIDDIAKLGVSKDYLLKGIK